MGSIRALMATILLLICANSAYSDQLLQIVRHVINSNPAVLSAKAQKKASRHDVDRAKAGYYPVLDLDVSRSRVRINSPSLRDRKVAPTYFWEVKRKLELDQMLFDGFRVSNTVKRDCYSHLADNANYINVRQNSVLQVIEAYLNIAREEEVIRASLDNIKLNKRTLKMAKERLLGNYGQRSAVNIATSRLILAETQLSLSKERKNRVLNQFYNLTGVSPPKVIEIPRVPYSYVPRNIPRLEAALLKHHPALIEQKRRVTSSEATIGISRAGYYPTFNFIIAGTKDSDIGGSRGHINNLSGKLAVSFNLFNGGADRAAVKGAIERRNNNEEKLKNLRRGFLELGRNDWYNYYNSARQQKHFSRYKEVSYKVVKDYREQFKIGKRKMFEVLGVQQELYSAKVSYINSKYDKIIGVYRILSDMGILIPTLFNETLEG
jgi:adhesin transport system outer membrane protein